MTQKETWTVTREVFLRAFRRGTLFDGEVMSVTCSDPDAFESNGDRWAADRWADDGGLA